MFINGHPINFVRDKDRAIDFYKKLYLRIPRGANLDFLRSNLRLIKITDPANGEDVYDNLEDAISSLGPTNENTDPGWQRARRRRRFLIRQQ